MTITPEQAAKVNPNRSSRIVARILNEAIEAGLVVDPRGKDPAFYVSYETSARLKDFARESGDADASWSTIIGTLLRIAEYHGVGHLTRSEMLTAEHANDPEIVEELDAEIDRIRDEKIDTLITSLVALRELVAGQRDRIEDVRRSSDEKLATSEAALGQRLLALEKGSVFAAARNDSGWVI